MKTRSRGTMAVRWAVVLIAAVWVVGGTARAQQVQVSGASSGEVNVYIAEQGDTLWDIADRFFNDPDYWPTLWSFNPHITNPNWIFPGDQVFLVPPQPQVQAPQGYRVTESRYSGGPQVEMVLGRRVGFLSEDQFKGSGVLSNSREERVYLGETDEAYIRFETQRRVKPGDLFLVFRVEKRVKHPKSGKKIGYIVRYLGVSKVTSTETPLNKAVVLMAFQEIERGDRVVPFAPMQRVVPAVRNAAELSGYIVYNFEGLEALGEYHYVVIDKGSRDGVQAGNRFVVHQKGDGVEAFNPKPKKRKDFPEELNGEILVIEAQEESCLGIVTYANREFEVGAQVDMIAGY